VLSKLITDADSYFAPGGAGAAQDHYNRGLEKSIGQFDQTHSLKLSTLYELPVGRGRRYRLRGFLDHLAGGWRVGAIMSYMSGFPVALSRNNPLPIFNAVTRPVVTSYDNWRDPVEGKFDPAVDRFLDRSVFPAQPNEQFGNVTRFNPKVRAFPGFNENISVAKSFHLGEVTRFDLRWEAFNILNRVQFGTGNLNLNSNAFGVVNTQVNTPRQMQVAIKVYW
jgi:hypothetical protein